MDDTLPSLSKSQHEKNIAMLFDTLKELKMSTNVRSDASICSKVENLLSKEMDKIHMSQYIGLECDTDEEIQEDDCEIECFTDDESIQMPVDYDIEKMFEIVKKRDFSKWSISTIHGRYKKIHLDDAGRRQLSRMRSHIKRGTIKNRIEYEKLRNDIWNEVYSLDKEGVILHDSDIQQIAMIKANERNHHDFIASDGWVYYFKEQHKIVECYSDKVPVQKTCDDEIKLKSSIKKFKSEQIPAIMAAYDLNKIWNVDQMGLQLIIPPGRKIILRGTKKIIRSVQCIDTKIHSFTIHIQMKASGKLSRKLPVFLYESVDLAKRGRMEIGNYPNLHPYSSKSSQTGSDIAMQWMKEVFFDVIENDSVVIIDSWSGYNQMMKMSEISDKKMKIIQLPFGSSSVLQPLDVYFNRPFKDFIRRILTKIQWQQNDYMLKDRENVLNVLDMIWFQCKAPRFENLLKYSWFRAGYTQEHSPDFMTPAQFCLEFRGYEKCKAVSCTNFCFIRCAHCEKYYCFNDALEHRHHMEYC